MNERDRKEKKDRLVKLAEEFHELYYDKSICFAGVSWGGCEIQLNEDSMKTLFPNTEFYRESFSDEYDKISTIYRGKRFFALVDKEEQ